MQLRHILFIHIFSLICTCASAQSTTINASSGFLEDYSRLSPPLSAEGNFHSYVAPGVKGRPLGRVYLMPLGSYPENAEFKYIDRATLAALASKFDSELNEKLTGKIDLANSPEQADTIIQMAVTASVAIEPKRGVVDYIPLRLITKPIKDAAMGEKQEIVVTLETKVRDTKTDQVIYESLEQATGKTMGRADDTNLHADIKELEPVIDGTTTKIAESISKMQPGVVIVTRQ